MMFARLVEAFPMHEFKNLELSALVDMLEHHTARYISILSAGGSRKEFETCKMIIEFLQAEIEQRKAGRGKQTTDQHNRP